ncbi:uncharacterized protein E5676_scaffold446G00300 [Cucumis melo var. makuwa]|uniref:Uncharacterized protein n=1 Tax=Cucumis melo var. makuwa TaxID=1194695 RepID=A0A5A7VL70_CUCMM|nr:uncharacterized protein E6C27_scaffold21G00540 [Cucumis melo var. makuwa]TYJ99828.1 uncharacterized protein E5676_scaffold446G00300 [Cucumis melo var. makuwa]
MLEKCFDVMRYPEKRKVRLATLLLQKEAEGWWKSILARGLRFVIRTLVTTIAKWTDFSKLVKTALRVEQSLTKENSIVELSRGTSIASGFRGRIIGVGVLLVLVCVNSMDSQGISREIAYREGAGGARQREVIERPRQQGKVYVMTQQEAEDVPDVITDRGRGKSRGKLANDKK